jgi:hypothetical protein
VAPNDTETNMQKNRRTEVYIRDGDRQHEVDTSLDFDLPVEEAAPAVEEDTIK